MIRFSARLAGSLALCWAAWGALPASAAAAPPTVAPSPVTNEQVWSGALEVPGTKLELFLHLTPLEGGSYRGSLEVPLQGARGIPLEDARLQDGRLSFQVPSIHASFEGTLDAQGRAVGQWKQGGASLPLTLARAATAAVPELKRPQTPVPPFPYRSEEVRVPNTADGVTLAGTLTLPEGRGPFAAAVLITGSGPQDRDETLFGHKPFAVIADALTRRGVAVLRLDDRGIGSSTGSFQSATSQDFARDTEAAVRFLRARPDVDPARVGLIGHSEGAIVAPIVASRDPKIDFVVLLAGSGVRGEQVVMRQLEDLLRAEGASSAVVAEQLKLQAATLALAVEPGSDERRKQALDDLLKKAVPDDQMRRAQIDMLLSPWYRGFLSLDPQVYLAKVKAPVLAMNGTKDLQVNAATNLPAIERALKRGGNRQVTVVELPGLNHLFQKADKGLVSEYATIEETFDPAALRQLTDWVVRASAPARKP